MLYNLSPLPLKHTYGHQEEKNEKSVLVSGRTSASFHCETPSFLTNISFLGLEVAPG